MKCSKCSEKAKLSYKNKQELIDNQMCYSCNFWRKKVEEFGDNNIVVDQTHYTIGPVLPKNTSVFRGFGGSKFIILKNNKLKPIVTHNLWCQGDIPKIWKDQLPNNAKFLKDDSST